MLELKLAVSEAYNEETGKFIPMDEVAVRFEHSLVSLSKWESKYKKPFLSDFPEHKKTEEEAADYLRFMVLDELDFDLFDRLDTDRVGDIQKYITDTQTATTFPHDESPNKINRELVTSELIYYWMVALNVPFETQHWHLNRLITLIQVINHKNAPPKKRSRATMAEQQRRLNAERKAKYGTNG